jgi:hypothetical protein
MNNIHIIIFFAIFLQSFSFQEPNPKICINCKHFINDNISPSDYIFGKCGFFKETITDNSHLIIGGSIVETNYYPYASTARSMEHLCGEKGKYYIKKNLKKNKNFEIDF